MSWSIMGSLPNDLISVQGKQLWKQLLSKIWPFLTELKIISTPIDSLQIRLIEIFEASAVSLNLTNPRQNILKKILWFSTCIIRQNNK